jgi:putative addiction module component (TIGR02574 family)
MNHDSVLSEIRSWPIEDRLRLIDQVWESISDEPGSILSSAHTDELQLRLDAYRDDPKAGSPWEEVEARLRGSRP